MLSLPKHLQDKINAREEEDALRTLAVKSQGEDFYSNDYLGFAQSEQIYKNAAQIIEGQTYYNGSTGSRLISGTHPLHLQAEEMLASFHQAETALLYNSGYDANLGLFSCVLQKGDVLLFDELLHASCRDGILLSNAKSYKFAHNSPDDLENKILRFKFNSKTLYVAVEAVYSMDGDTAPLLQIVQLCKKHGVRLIVDEAHSSGVLGENGQGLVSHLGVTNEVFARVHTFGKALGCHGAVVLGNQQLKNYLINFSRSFIYTTAINLHSVATVLAAYQQLLKGNRVQQLTSIIFFFNQQVKELGLSNLFIPSNSAIHCCLITGNSKVKQLAIQIQEQGFVVKPVLSPTVPKGKERIRICLHTFNTNHQVLALLQSVKNIIT